MTDGKETRLTRMIEERNNPAAAGPVLHKGILKLHHEKFRIMSFANLDSSIQYLPGIGPKRAVPFAKIGIKTIRDMLFYFPARYLDRSTIVNSSQLAQFIREGNDSEVTIIGTVYNKESKRFGGREILIVNFRDKGGFFEGVWFQGARYHINKFVIGETFAISGKPAFSKFGNLQFPHPDYDKITEDETQQFYNTGKILPVYRLPKELKEKNIGDMSLRRMAMAAVDQYAVYIPETLPDSVIRKYKFLPLNELVRKVHYPASMDEITECHRRLKYEELFYLEILIAMRKRNVKEELPGIQFENKTEMIREFMTTLPFELTQAQKKVSREIFRDMLTPKPMNRLLQGDVGSGKTIVALIAMLLAVENGYQAVMMAPTEILANQHYLNISKLIKRYCETFPERMVNVSLLIGGQKKSVRTEHLNAIATGSSQIVIGTHALFEEEVLFNKLGLVVVDEQHRFGVVQRARLMNKGLNPDVLVMSATPIPRTLSLTVYGDLDNSVIDEMPANRIPITTSLRGESRLPAILEFAKEKIKDGYQTFIVYPLVEESEKLDLKAAEENYAELSATYLQDCRTGLVHGRMKWSEKESIMKKFADKEFDILFATTVIEVGIDIPDANIIIINEAHRFGLSQLHQLRGRVGRSEKQGYCILVTKDETAASASRFRGQLDRMPAWMMEKFKSAIRLEAMVQHTDGFKIADIDMKLRGPGDIFGIRQSGYPELKYAVLTEDTEILINAQRDAFEIIAHDPHLQQHQFHPIKSHLRAHYSESLRYAHIA